MAATARSLKMCETLSGHDIFAGSTSPASVSRPRIITCLNKAGGGGERKPAVGRAAGCASSACVLVSETKTDKGVDLRSLSGYVADKVLSPWMKFIKKHNQLNIQMLMEKVIIDCRFFTLLAVAGSLVGSLLCFVEGCGLTLNSYLHYFHSTSQMSEPIHVVPILIEAIDMFLVGSAMFTFGMALHVMFVGQNIRGKGSTKARNFYLQKLPPWTGIGIESPIQAKSKIGHAVMMILQVQVLEKLKSIPVTSGMDLACFAGAVFLSSVSIFILSRTVAAYAKNRI